MKSCTFIHILAAVILTCTASCSKYDSSQPHKTRLEAFRDKYIPQSREDSSSMRGKLPPDTVIYVSGVEFPDDYDWKRDTAYGEVSARIVLFRNGEKIVEIPTGPDEEASADPDRHHLIDGHIYTEWNSRAGTFIGRDGDRLFSYPEREILHGIQIDGEHVWTLGQHERGITLRRDGEVIMGRDGCFIQGSILDRADYPGGALYSDSGHMYFSYWRPETEHSDRRAWFIVEDGKETQVRTEGDGIFDIRIKDGKMEMTAVSIPQATTVQYQYGEHQVLVIVYHDGTMLVRNPPAGISKFSSGSYYFFSFRNSFFLDGELFLALTPQEDGKPFIWRNGKTTGLDINGFLTAVSVSVIPRQGT